MRITESQLRKVVRQEILREAAASEAEYAQKLLDYLMTPEGRKAAEVAVKAFKASESGALPESRRHRGRVFREALGPDDDATFTAAGSLVGGALLYGLCLHAGMTAGAEKMAVAMLAGIPLGIGVGAMIDYLKNKAGASGGPR